MIDGHVHQQLGTLIAEVKNLREDFRRAEDRSDAARALVSRRVEDLAGRVGALEGAVATARDDIREMKPVTEDVRKWKLMGLGALGVIGIGGASLGVTFADVVKRGLALMRMG